MLQRPKLGLVTVFALACSSDDGPKVAAEPCAKRGVTSALRFQPGDADGHADPFGAKGAGQARAGRVRDASMIVQAADAKAKVRVGDFVLANDRISLYVAGARITDGYLPFGGEIITLDPVGDDGRPRAISRYEETIMAFSRQSVAPDTVSVLNDGADGKAAVVRVSGVLKNIPILEVVAGLLREEYNFPAALDFVLEPGAEKVSIRLSLANTRDEEVGFFSKEIHGFLHGARAQLFTSSGGFGSASGQSSFLAFDGGDYGFAWRLVGRTVNSGLDAVGFQQFNGKGLALAACEKKTTDFVEIVPGGPELDGVLAALRRVDGATSHRPVQGRVVEASGEALQGAFVLALAADGAVLSRARSDRDGRFTIHVPSASAPSVKLAVAKPGYARPEPTGVPEGEALLTMPARGTLTVRAKEAGTARALPVRVQVIPSLAPAPTPETWGVPEEGAGRLYQAFPERGEVSLAVPPGEHRVIVSRGYEYELFDQKVTIEAGKTSTIEPVLEHSVDSTGVMCADFHIHTIYSPDADDAVELKVRSAVADGLDIPVSSEHEYVIDFQPVVEALGLGDFAFGMPSEELSTWTFGHFGVVPKTPHPDMLNQGAVDWYGKSTNEMFKMVNALPEQPVIIVNHPQMGGFQGYFSATGFTKERAAGEGERWSDDFAAVEVFNDSDFQKNRAASVASWFAILNAGKTVWAVGSSDSHRIATNPVGYPRTCLRVGHDDPRKLTRESVRDALRAGAAVVSGGLTMSVTGPDGKGPGETSTAGAYRVAIGSPTFIEAKTLEVIVDGETVKTIELSPTPAPGAGRRYEATVDVSATSSRPRHWVVFHARGPDGADLSPLHPGRTAFAVSNPVFF